MTKANPREAQLRARLAALQARLTSIETELASHNDPDWEESAVEREADEVLEGIGMSGQQEIRRIEAALDRIVAGTYGECVSCGAQIADARLDLLPDTPFCSTCAA